jgi:5-methylcytosine-specific restriction endonuclease McrA
MSGADSSQWKGGITPHQTLIRNSKEYILWTNAVLKRDGYKCQRCPQVGGKLHAHHLRKFSVILNDLRQSYPLLSVVEVSLTCNELWDVSNGITLCKSCHNKEHKTHVEDGEQL